MKVFLISLLCAGFFGCAAIQKGQKVAHQTAEYSSTHKFKSSVEDIELGIKSHVMLQQMLMKRGADASEINPPLINGIYKYDDKLLKVSRTKSPGNPLNKLKSDPKETELLGFKKIYIIKDHGDYRTLLVKSFQEDIPTQRKSKNKIDVSIMGIGINYRDYKDVDYVLKTAKVDKTEQWQIISRVEPKAAEKVRVRIANEVSAQM